MDDEKNNFRREIPLKTSDPRLTPVEIKHRKGVCARARMFLHTRDDAAQMSKWENKMERMEEEESSRNGCSVCGFKHHVGLFAHRAGYYMELI